MSAVEVVVLRAECGWCGKVLREGAQPVTTGICSECADTWKPAGRAKPQPMRVDTVKLSLDDVLYVNDLEHTIKRLAADAHDASEFRDLSELVLKLDGIVAYASEWKRWADRRMDERAEHPREAVPPVEVS